MKFGFFAALALCAAAFMQVSATAAPPLKIIWDQSALDGAGGGIADASAGCGPTADSIHLASDFHLEDPYLLRQVTTFYTAVAPEAFDATVEAWLWVTPKKGRLPAPTADPRTGGHLVSVHTELNAGHLALVAPDLNLPLGPGDYWISLTPVVAVGGDRPERHLVARGAWGAPSVAFTACGVAHWTPHWSGTDGSLLIEGTPRKAATAETGGGSWPWRRLR